MVQWKGELNITEYHKVQYKINRKNNVKQCHEACHLVTKFEHQVKYLADSGASHIVAIPFILESLVI
jgi:hypothetical protein